VQPVGPGKYVFDIGCEQHGEYVESEQVKEVVQIVLNMRELSKSNLLWSNL